MANAQSANVIVVDTTAAFPSAKNIIGIKYIAGTTPSVLIKSGASASGVVLWEEDGSSDIFNQVVIRDMQGVHVTIAGTGTKVYLYLE